MATTMTAKAQVTIPKAVRDKVGIQPGDRVEVQANSEGVIIRKAFTKSFDPDAFKKTLKDIQRRRAHQQFTTDEIMAMTRGED